MAVSFGVAAGLAAGVATGLAAGLTSGVATVFLIAVAVGLVTTSALNVFTNGKYYNIDDVLNHM